MSKSRKKSAQRRPHSTRKSLKQHQQEQDSDNKKNQYLTTPSPYSKTLHINQTPWPKCVQKPNIGKDSEELYAEVLRHKQAINQLTDENTKLKTKVAIVEKERLKLAERLEGGSLNDRLTGRSSSEKNWDITRAINLEHMLQEAKKEIEFLKKQNNKIKKSTKFRDFVQDDIEKIKAFEEVSRLRLVIDSYEAKLKNPQKEYHKQAQVILKERNKNKKKQLSQQIENLKKQLQSKQTSQQQLIAQIQEWKNRERTALQMVENLQQNLNSSANNASEKEVQMQEIIRMEKRNLQGSLQKIETLKQQLQNQRLKQLNLETEKKKLNNSLLQMEKVQRQLQVERAKNVQLQKIIEKKKQKISDKIQHDAKVQNIQPKQKPKFNKEVTKEQRIKQLLSYRSKGCKYPFQITRNNIQKINQDRLTIADLKKIFKVQPYYLNQEQIQFLLMYIFETTTISNTKSIETSTLIQKLRNMFDDDNFPTEQEQQSTFEQLAIVLAYNRKKLLKQFFQLTNQKTIPKQQLEYVLSSLAFNNSQIDILLSYLSLNSEDMQHLQYNLLFDKFMPEKLHTNEDQQDQKSNQTFYQVHTEKTEREDIQVEEQAQEASAANNTSQYVQDNFRKNALNHKFLLKAIDNFTKTDFLKKSINHFVNQNLLDSSIMTFNKTGQQARERKGEN